MKKYLLIISAVFSLLTTKAGNQNIANLISSSDWETLFPNRNALYSYSAFTQAVDELSDYQVKYENPGSWGLKVTVTRKSTNATHSYNITSANWPGDAVTVDFENFCNTGNDKNDRRELAAFFSNITKETTGGTTEVFSGQDNSHSKWGLYFLKEVNPWSSYVASSTDYPGASGKTYEGRGPIQLSWNYNYGRFSDFLYGDKSVLLNNPDELSTNGVTSFKSAIWFWMTPQCPKPSCHQVMHEIHDESAVSYSQTKMSKKGFLHTINIINGAVECRNTSLISKVQLRADLYSYFMDKLGFSASERTAENTGDYSTLCVEGSSVMTDYTECAFRDIIINSCSSPALGTDKSLSGGSASLNANITLKSGESIAWYKDNVLIDGATSTTYTATETGTYKAVVTGTDCSKEDAIVISAEGSGGGCLQASPTNDGIFCGSGGEGGPESTTVTITGGGGTYNLYDVATGGEVIKSGSQFTFDYTNMNQGESVTYYVEEPAGTVYTVGATGRWTTDPDTKDGWLRPDEVEFGSNPGLSYLDNRIVFTIDQDMTLESIDFDLAFVGDGHDHQLVVEIYPKGQLTGLVASKTIDLDGVSFSQWDQEIYTAPLGLELPAGQYSLDLSKTTAFIQVGQYSSAQVGTFPYLDWGEQGIIAFDGAESRENPQWGLFTNYTTGAYNWKFSTAGGSSSCERTPFTITNECTTGLNDITSQNIEVFPNPAQDLLNISLKGIELNGAIIEMYNQVGQIVLTKSISSSTSAARINTNDLTEGVYFIKVTSGNNSYNSNVVITK